MTLRQVTNLFRRRKKNYKGDTTVTTFEVYTDIIYQDKAFEDENKDNSNIMLYLNIENFPKESISLLKSTIDILKINSINYSINILSEENIVEMVIIGTIYAFNNFIEYVDDNQDDHGLIIFDIYNSLKSNLFPDINLSIKRELNPPEMKLKDIIDLKSEIKAKKIVIAEITNPSILPFKDAAQIIRATIIMTDDIFNTYFINSNLNWYERENPIKEDTNIIIINIDLVKFLKVVNYLPEEIKFPLYEKISLYPYFNITIPKVGTSYMDIQIEKDKKKYTENYNIFEWSYFLFGVDLSFSLENNSDIDIKENINNNFYTDIDEEI